MKEKKHFKAFIRVVKSINVDQYYNAFGSENVIHEPLVLAEDKKEVKEYLLKEYPQFFQKGKVYERETKDQAQFFYVVIYELWKGEMELVEKGKWVCSQCGQEHENEYVSRPQKNHNLFPDLLFCDDGQKTCLNNYKKEYYKDVEFVDDLAYIKKDSPNYIYKITEKSTNKCYVGKTRNAPFFRWWNHLTKSSSPFGLYFRTTRLSDWTFEVLEELPFNVSDSDIFKIESDYIRQFNSIENGYNSVISRSEMICANSGQTDIFENEKQQQHDTTIEVPTME